MHKTIFTSEHVSPGHPDKICDSIAEAIVDYHIQNSVKSRVAVDGLIKNRTLVLAGEITSDAKPDYQILARHVIKEIGYTEDISPDCNNENLEVTTIFTEQSPDIAQGVDSVEGTEAAGDIGIMFGGAVKEAPDFTCWSHYIARLLSYHIYTSGLTWLRPDQKTQVSIAYEDGVPVKIEEIVICVSHEAGLEHNTIINNINQVITETLSEFSVREGWRIAVDEYKLQVNPTGKFEVFGPTADSGLVGRKIVCDQYGGYFPVGGGNLNGKDATKVDRSAVYMARYVAKSIVAKGMADLCQIQVAYSIGKIDPVSINIETFGSHKVHIKEITDYVNTFSFRPGDIIKRFQLNEENRNWLYQDLGMYGHIGKRFTGVQVPWEIVE